MSDFGTFRDAAKIGRVPASRPPGGRFGHGLRLMMIRVIILPLIKKSAHYATTRPTNAGKWAWLGVLEGAWPPTESGRKLDGEGGGGGGGGG